MSSPAFSVVDLFEQRMAEFAGSRFGVAVASCTDALFLSYKYTKIKKAVFPARTYISAVSSAIHAGAEVSFKDSYWTGVYKIEPHEIYDSAGRMRKNMYQGGLYCLSFHAYKSIPIGKGGMILTDDIKAYEWLRLARHEGRHVEKSFMEDNIEMLGWNCYMTPEQAARGLQLLEHLDDNQPDICSSRDYPDLRKMSIFNVVA